MCATSTIINKGFTATEKIADATYYTKNIHNNTLHGVVEPTFSDGEFSAVISDEYVLFVEKFFADEDDAHMFVMKQIKKLSA